MASTAVQHKVGSNFNETQSLLPICCSLIRVASYTLILYYIFRSLASSGLKKVWLLLCRM